MRHSAFCVVRTVWCVCLAGGTVAAQAPTQNAERTTQNVRFGVTVSRDTVTVGEPFEVRVRIQAPPDARIVFPNAPDTAGTVQARDPRTVATRDSVNARDQIASYHVAAWDIGMQPVLFDEVIVTWTTRGARQQQRVALGTVRVFVRTVLPADTALRVPKPARPLWEVTPFPWWIVALVAAAIALAIWWWRRRKQRVVVVPVIAVDPYVRANMEFDRVEAMGLVGAGERTRYVALVVEILRDYLAARHAEAPLSLTTRELIAALRRRPSIPIDALTKALGDADLAKFAGFALTEERARGVARDARAIVEREHRASQAMQVPAQAAA